MPALERQVRKTRISTFGSHVIDFGVSLKSNRKSMRVLKLEINMIRFVF